MKKIENRQTDLAFPNPDGSMKPPRKFGDLMIDCLNGLDPLQGGLNTEQQLERIRVMKFVKDQWNKPEIELENADFAVLFKCVESMSWGVVHPAIGEFIEYMREVNNQELKK